MKLKIWDVGFSIWDGASHQDSELPAEGCIDNPSSVCKQQRDHRPLALSSADSNTGTVLGTSSLLF